MFEVRGEQEVFDSIALVVFGSMDVFKSSNHSHLTALQTTVPILADFLQASKRDHRGRPSNEVCNILLHIIEVCQAPFKGTPPPSSHYSPTAEDSICAGFFSISSKAFWTSKLCCRCYSETASQSIRLMLKGIVWTSISYPGNFHHFLSTWCIYCIFSEKSDVVSAH